MTTLSLRRPRMIYKQTAIAQGAGADTRLALSQVAFCAGARGALKVRDHMIAEGDYEALQQGYRASWPTAQAHPGAASSSAAALTAMTWRSKVVRARRRRRCSSALRQPLDLSHPDGRTCGLGCLGVP